MKNRLSKSVVWVLWVAPLMVIAGKATAQPLPAARVLRTELMQVTGPIPAMQVLDQLEAKYGWQLTYEDPPHQFAGDMVDLTDPTVRKLNPYAPPVWAARSKPLQVAVDILANTLKPDRERVMQRLVDAYISSGNPGTLRWRKVGDLIDVYPSLRRDLYGAVKPAGSVLDARITFPLRQQSCLLTLEAILAQTSKASGWAMALGTVPLDALQAPVCKQGASDESARSVLMRVFGDVNAWRKASGSAPLTITWRLLFRPGEKTYYFNAHIVTVQ